MSSDHLTVLTNEALWDAKDVARFLKVSRGWVYQHAEDGTLPSVRIGGLRRFVPSQIRAYSLGQVPSGDAVMALPRRGR